MTSVVSGSTIDVESVASDMRGWPSNAVISERRLRRFSLAANAHKLPRRIAFDFAKPLPLDAFADLTFVLQGGTEVDLACDLVQGDKGFPEIRAVTSEGSIYRFKRGNIKDFFDTQRPAERQTVRLPLRYFIFDHDTKANPHSETAFPQAALSRLMFDFLPHPDRVATLIFGDVSLSAESSVRFARPMTETEAMSIEGVWPVHPMSPFYTDAARIQLAVTVSGKNLGPIADLRRRIVVHSADGTKIHDAVGRARLGKEYRTLRLPSRGCYAVAAMLEDAQGQPVAAVEAGVGFGVNSARIRGGILGFSDVAFENEIGQMGGRFQRRIITVGTLGLEAEDFGRGWTRARCPIPTCAPVPPQDVIVTLRGMPDWLSSRKGQPDAYRYAPSDWALYAKGIRFLAGRMRESGFRFLETWNEASVSHEWADSMENLIRLHQVTYEAAKEVFPDITILGGTTHTFHHDFIARFLDAGGARWCDALAIHGYTYRVREIAEDFARVRAALDQRGLEDFPIFMTEVGFRTPAFTLADQARHLARTVLHGSATRHLKSVIWFRLENLAIEGGADYNQNASTGYAGIGYRKGVVRPMVLAYRMLARFLARYPVATLTRTDTEERFTFAPASGDGPPAIVVEGYLTPDHVSRVALPEGYKAFGLYGNELAASSGWVTSAVGPVFLIPAAAAEACVSGD